MDQNIFLIGFMGSGKSYWGRIWALQNGYTFYDLDEQIEKESKMSIEKIFEKQGEGKFRDLEKSHLRKFKNKKKCLISCGGGTPCYFSNLEWMKQYGKTIYLKASPEYILDRVMDETTKRPLLKEVNTSELLFFIQKKLKEREPVYLKAHHILEVEKLNDDSLKFLKKEDTKEIVNPGFDKGSKISGKKIITENKKSSEENISASSGKRMIKSS